MIVLYEDRFETEWDDFVLNKSINGNFLQTRRFYNYHEKGKFIDASVIVMHNEEIAAVMPANVIDGGKVLISHQGSTFGGIVVGRDYANSKGYEFIFGEITDFFVHMGYQRCELKMHNWLYSPDCRHNELCDYFFHLYNFKLISEVGFYIDLSYLEDDFTKNYEKLKRRKLSKALKNGLLFKRIDSDEEIAEFYDVLSDNMLKFHTKPIHTLGELIDFKNNRLKEETFFYAVYHERTMIAGSMVWNFCNKKVFHTQYLASKHEYLDYCPNEYLYTELIKTAKSDNYSYLSYGTACLGHEKAYNTSLGMYKEGYNTDSYVNRCYIWIK